MPSQEAMEAAKQFNFKCDSCKGFGCAACNETGLGFGVTKRLAELLDKFAKDRQQK